jgi:hypothetical protein
MARRRSRARAVLTVECLEGRTLLSSYGVVVKGIGPWTGEPQFIDARHNLIPWGSWDVHGYHSDPSLKLTPQGYPLSNASTFGFLTNYPDGVYQVSYQGKADLFFAGIGANNGPFTLGSDGYYHGSITINHSWYNGSALVLHAQGLDPSKPFGNMSIIPPGYSTPLTQEYTSTFLKQLQPFSELRFVEWTQTINSTEKNWSDRVPPDWFTAAGPGGVSFEDIIELSNEAHKDMWINVPALATNDFITQLARLIYNKLDPGLNVYVEYSNETWNNFFSENAQVFAAGKANPIVNQSGDIIAQQTAYMTKVIGDIFKSVFGSASSRVLPVLGGWATQPNYDTDELQFLKQHYGNPAKSIYALATAPYVDLASGTDVSGLTMNGLFASAFQNLDTTFPQMLDADLAVAHTYNVGLVTYEGGQSFNPFNGINEPLKHQAQSDPRMNDFYRRMIEIWNQHVGSLFTFYALNDPFWGLLPSITSPGGPKWDGVMSAILPVGDADLDGVVNRNDKAIVTANQGMKGAWWEQGDFNHDGVVDGNDLNLLQGKMAFKGSDAATQGNWKGVYGADGYNVIGDMSSYPSYATVTPSGVSPITWTNNTSDLRALQKGDPGTTNRTATGWYSSNQFTIDLKLTHGKIHEVSIYAVDYDHLNRSERVDLIDPSTGKVVDSRTLSSFTLGEYLSWNLTGHMQLRFTNLSGPNAVVSGLFFGGAASPSYLAPDTTTQGTWKNNYGADGYNVIGDLSSYPSYAKVTPSGTSSYTWASSTTDRRALQKADAGATDRIAACWYSSTQFAVDLKLTDGLTHKISIYAVDWDKRGRSERVDVVDPSTGKVLDSRTLSSFNNGVYVTWNLTGHVQLRFTSLAGPNAVLSGLFFNSKFT